MSERRARSPHWPGGPADKAGGGSCVEACPCSVRELTATGFNSDRNGEGSEAHNYAASWSE